MKAPFTRPDDLRRLLPKRPADSNKGMYGHVLLIVGSRGMSGAAVLSALGALRVGAGLVSVGIVGSERALVAQALPEALTLELPEDRHGTLSLRALPVIETYIKTRRISVVATGPGLSVGSAVARLLKTLVRRVSLPMVIDADGLNNLKPNDVRQTGPRVLTPHPTEMMRFLSRENKISTAEREPLTRRTAADLGLVCLLKGNKTVISDGRRSVLNPTGSPVMATGGMGDVLTGVIAGLLAQQLSPWDAARTGAYLHGLAAMLARVTDRGLLAREVADAVPYAIRKIHGRA